MSDEDFRVALRGALEQAGWSQAKLGQALGLPESVQQTRVSTWLNGSQHPPPPPVVCQIEEVLDLAPGTLTLHLGYLPPRARTEVRSVPDAIDADPALDARARRALKNLYATLADDSSPRAS